MTQSTERSSRILTSAPVLASVLLASALAACGYHVGGKADLIPKTIKTIAIPAFGNGSVRYQIATLLAADVTREFHSRTHYVIVTDPAQADAVLAGTVTNFATLGGTTTDPTTGRATSSQIILTLRVALTDRHTGKVLFERTAFEFRERDEIATDLKSYFDESGTAMKRVSRDAARSVVTAILEAF
jgi:outer membrane lipopolysaccharide assembly protein LptE/RlpB